MRELRTLFQLIFKCNWSIFNLKLLKQYFDHYLHDMYGIKQILICNCHKNNLFQVSHNKYLLLNVNIKKKIFFHVCIITIKIAILRLN